MLPAMLMAPEVAQACATCFGDPESPMSKGVVAGVYVLIGIVGFVLAGVACTGVFWMHRGRTLSQGTTPDDSSPVT